MVLYLYVLEMEHNFPWLRGNHFLPFLLCFQKLLELLACELYPSSSQALGSSFLLPAESLLPTSLLSFTLFLFLQPSQDCAIRLDLPAQPRVEMEWHS